MLVIKCDNCNEIFDIKPKKRKEGNKIITYTNCPKCNKEYLSRRDYNER